MQISSRYDSLTASINSGVSSRGENITLVISELLHECTCAWGKIDLFEALVSTYCVTGYVIGRLVNLNNDPDYVYVAMH